MKELQASLARLRETMQLQMPASLAHQYRFNALNSSLGPSLRAYRSHMRSLPPALDQARARQLGLSAPRLAELEERFSALREHYRVQSDQALAMRRGMEILRGRPAEQMGFSSETMERAAELLEGLSRGQSGQRSEGISEDLALDEESQLEETVQALEPVIRDIPPDWTRGAVVIYVSILVFFLVVHLSITKPDLAEVLIGNGGLDAAACAGAAGWLTGKIWDRLYPDQNGSDDEN